MSQQNKGLEFLMGLVIGGLIGAALALVLAPQPGVETRRQIKSKSLELKDRTAEGLAEAGQAAKEQAVAWQEKGQGVLDKGLQSAKETFDRAKQSASD